MVPRSGLSQFNGELAEMKMIRLQFARTLSLLWRRPELIPEVLSLRRPGAPRAATRPRPAMRCTGGMVDLESALGAVRTSSSPSRALPPGRSPCKVTGSLTNRHVSVSFTRLSSRVLRSGDRVPRSGVAAAALSRSPERLGRNVRPPRRAAWLELGRLGVKDFARAERQCAARPEETAKQVLRIRRKDSQGAFELSYLRAWRGGDPAKSQQAGIHGMLVQLVTIGAIGNPFCHLS